MLSFLAMEHHGTPATMSDKIVRALFAAGIAAGFITLIIFLGTR